MKNGNMNLALDIEAGDYDRNLPTHMIKNKVFGRKPNRIIYWYAQRKKDGKMEIKATYTVQDFTGDMFRNKVSWE